MSMTVSAVKARQNLGELLNIVSLRHEDVIIERAGKKIARLTTLDKEDAVLEPVAEYRTQKKTRDVSSKEALGFYGSAEARSGSMLPDLEEDAMPKHPEIMDLLGLGKELWKSTGLTPDEYVRKEREEWD